MRHVDVPLLLMGCGFGLLALFFYVLDWRKQDREHYGKRFGRKRASIWVLPAILCVVLTFVCFKAAFSK